MLGFGRKLTLSVVAVAAGLVIAASPATAAGFYSLFGDAQIVGGGNPGNAAQIVSDAAMAGFGGVEFSVSPTSWSTFGSLSLDFNVTDDGCGGGSPRFGLGVDTNTDNVADGYVFIAIGPSPNFTGCAAGWQQTGNLIGNADAGRYDYSQFGGSPFTTYSGAPANVLSGTVVEVFVIVDGSWSPDATNGDGEQTVLVDNANVDGAVYAFLSADECKDGGWKGLTRTDGTAFANQGDCVQFAQTGM